jgi:hypothetical protein
MYVIPPGWQFVALVTMCEFVGQEVANTTGAYQVLTNPNPIRSGCVVYPGSPVVVLCSRISTSRIVSRSVLMLMNGYGGVPITKSRYMPPAVWMRWQWYEVGVSAGSKILAIPLGSERGGKGSTSRCVPSDR